MFTKKQIIALSKLTPSQRARREKTMIAERALNLRAGLIKDGVQIGFLPQTI